MNNSLQVASSLHWAAVWLLLLTNSLHAEKSNVPSSQGPAIEIEGARNWWFGVISQGHLMPLREEYECSQLGDTFGNQAQPLVLSDQGDVIWSESPLRISYDKGKLRIWGQPDLIHRHDAGDNLRDAFLLASKSYFRPSGRLPAKQLFSAAPIQHLDRTDVRSEPGGYS